MIWFYIATAIFGAAFVVPMLFGGMDLDSEIGLDAELEFDPEFELGTEVEAADASSSSTAESALSSFTSSLFSFRSLVFFLTFFGMVGTVLTLLDSNVLTTVVTAGALGVVAAAMHAQLFSYVSRTGSSSQRLNSDLEGRGAKVILPISGEQKGRVRSDVGGQPTFMVARPFLDGDTFGVGDSVVVVEMRNGTALVAEMSFPPNSINPNSTEGNN